MRVSVPAHVLVQELDGESVFLNLNSGRYFGLDEVGTRFWKVLATSASVQDAYETLLAEYEVDPETLRRDLLRLADDLVEQGLVEIARE
jgi:hypothetical protein